MRRAVFDFIATFKCTISFLQEVHLRDWGDVNLFSRERDRGVSSWSVGGVRSSGVGILFGDKGGEG